MRKQATVEFSVPVSEEEKKTASVLRDSLDDFSTKLEEFGDFFEVFQETIAEIQSGEDLIDVSDSVIKYLYKMREHFNGVVKALSIVMAHTNELYTEAKTQQMKDTVIAAFGEMRSLVIDLLRTCEDLNKEGFMDEVNAQASGIKKYMDQALSVSRDEWIAHIDRHILGRTRLS